MGEYFEHLYSQFLATISTSSDPEGATDACTTGDRAGDGESAANEGREESSVLRAAPPQSVAEDSTEQQPEGVAGDEVRRDTEGDGDVPKVERTDYPGALAATDSPTGGTEIQEVQKDGTSRSGAGVEQPSTDMSAFSGREGDMAVDVQQ